MNTKKRFSIAHYDNWPNPSLFYEAIKNSSPQFRDEIYDIYFGKIFRYKIDQGFYRNSDKPIEIAYGNVMGVEASDEQVDALFKIQQEFGITISLTLNQLNFPVELYFSEDNSVLNAFIDWLQVFYERGLRSCTLANNHMMRAGFLQKRFPEMKWKNTVNQQVSTAQQVLDYLYLGYNVIQLDRSLNRNLNELRRIKKAVEYYRELFPKKEIKTSLLVYEDCLPSCPFKREHDDIQIHFKEFNYWDSDLGSLSCARWRDWSDASILPRFGTNCIWPSIETLNEYAGLVDIFKHAGRLSSVVPRGEGRLQFAWLYEETAAVDSFSQIIENKLEPVHQWILGTGIFPYLTTSISSIKEHLKDSIWITEPGRILEQRAKNCNNQCYDCHLCEKTWGFPEIVSALEL
ncbi:MAG: hypothetical protein TUN42_01825 [Dehalogenimonas sp.]